MKSRMTAIFAMLVAIMVLAGCGDDDDKGDSGKPTPGVTATTVTIGSHQPLTGPAAPGYSQIAPAAEAFFKYLNKQGGVNGRKIKYIYKDDVYNPTKTVTVVRDLVLRDKVFAIFNGLGTPTHTKVVDYLNTQGVPDLFVASGCRCWDDPDKHPQTFGWQTDYVVEGKILGQYIKDNFAGKKIAYFTQADEFGEDGIEGLDKHVPQDQVVARETYQPGNTDVAPQISKIKRSGAEVVVGFTIPSYTALAHLASFKLGYKPQFVVSNVGADPGTLNSLLKSFSKGKAGAEVLEGMISDTYLPPTDDPGPWISLFKKIHKEFIPKQPFDFNTIYGMAAAYTFAQALEAAGENPTRESIVEAIENGGFRGPGLIPFRFSEDSHAGFTGVQLTQLKGGKVELQGDPLVTDNLDGEITSHTDPQPTPEEGGIITE